MKKNVFSLAVIFAFMLCALPSYADVTDNYCRINGVRYTIGNVIAEFGNNAAAVKGCCACGTSKSLCNPGYMEDYERTGKHDYNLTLIAAKHNHYQCLKYLVETCRGLVDNFASSRDLGRIPEGEYTQLMYAVKNGNVEMVKYLLSKGANANRRNFSGESAKDIASRKGNQEIINLLKNTSYTNNLDLKYKKEIIDTLRSIDYEDEIAFAGLEEYFKELI